VGKKKSFTKELVKTMTIRVCFFGTPEFAQPTLMALLNDPKFSVNLVVTQPDKPLGRAKGSNNSVKNFALSNSLKLIQPVSIKKLGRDFLDELDLYGSFDVGVVVAFGQILPKFLLDYFPFGCVNVHASLLPRWRGAAPIHRAIIAGDKETGITLMKMDVGLDTGDIISTTPYKLDSSVTGGSVTKALGLLGAQLTVRYLPLFITGEIIATPQSSDGVTYASKITKDELQIDWASSSSRIVKNIQAFTPDHGAYTYLAATGQRVKFFEAYDLSSYDYLISSLKPYLEMPSGVLIGPSKKIFKDVDLKRINSSLYELLSETLVIKATDSFLAVRSLQLAGKKVVTGSEFLRGLVNSNVEIHFN
jgi:methionyl-tRNA formyltransferase